ncbi:putative efflux protein, MATE family [Desulfocicer vacuolatum DSM 3385]|uniref:Putative efflux protein, MATE family n=1 Tax=Desulfocicer vacuolatum DSM 3385 TaxID=1121400 RepID=A0A1W2B7U6_9BACT|nr:MATE family efflux transporter [Desulfocicer vacuolatum]SMC68914.1 putative efflux protein, MATE family [Desulfocicer vacuolatum DSM 3385]
MFKFSKSQKRFLGLLLTLAIPIALQNLLTCSMSVIDILMVGQLNETAIAAVGIANQFVFMFIVIQYGIHSGVSIFTAQYWGKKEMSRIKHLSGMGILAGLTVAALFSYVALILPDNLISFFSKDEAVVRLGADYIRIVGGSFAFSAVIFSFMCNLRSMGFVKVPMVCSMVAVTFNIVLNYILIFGKWGFPALGVTGAGIATCTSKIVEGLFMAGIIYGKNYPLAANFKEMFSFGRPFLGRVFTTCWPVFLNELFWVTGISLYKLVYARIGTESIAAVNIVTTIEEFMFIPFFGIFHGGAIMIGNSIGAGQKKTAQAYGQFILITQLIIAVGAGFLMISSREFVLSFYNISPATYENAYYLMLVSGLIFWAKTTNFTTIVSVLRSGGDTQFGFLLDLTGVWCIGVPMAFFTAFYLGLPVYWVMALVAVEELFKLGVGIPRFFSQKWIRNLVTV